uniref:Uncharacterized protein n=1 Tax=Nelumbo nucifera TaxID=4432 RepID=A0A822YLR8_NELNU|nr:TPA_asm: hypothetical protein HUJ06_012323 [Nelumbo nucifera]
MLLQGYTAYSAKKIPSARINRALNQELVTRATNQFTGLQLSSGQPIFPTKRAILRKNIRQLGILSCLSIMLSPGI